MNPLQREILSISLLATGVLSFAFNFQPGVNIFWFAIFFINLLSLLILPFGIYSIISSTDFKKLKKDWGKTKKIYGSKTKLEGWLTWLNVLAVISFGWWFTGILYILSIVVHSALKSALNEKWAELEGKSKP